MWIVCLADNSYEISSLILSEKYQKQCFRMSSTKDMNGPFNEHWNFRSNKFDFDLEFNGPVNTV